jgi:hypothetical protein
MNRPGQGDKGEWALHWSAGDLAREELEEYHGEVAVAPTRTAMPQN